MTTQDPRLAFLADYLAFQAEVKNPEKSATNPHFKSKFAPLDETLAYLRPLLTKHGFALVQTIEPYGQGCTAMRSSLIHKAGHSIDSVMPLLLDKQTPQAMGSAISYARRYSIGPLCGFAGADEDDDGEAAGQRPAQRPQRPAQQPKKPPPAEDNPMVDVPFDGPADAILAIGECQTILALKIVGQKIKASKFLERFESGAMDRVKAAWTEREAELKTSMERAR